MKNRSLEEELRNLGKEKTSLEEELKNLGKKEISSPIPMPTPAQVILSQPDIPYPKMQSIREILGRPMLGGNILKDPTFIKQGKAARAYLDGNYEEAIRLARKVKVPLASNSGYLRAALNKTAWKEVDQALSSSILRNHYLRRARKRFNECVKEEPNWKIHHECLEARMGLVLTYLISKEYDKAEKGLDELNEVIESASKKEPEFINRLSFPAISIFTIISYYDMIQKGYPISDEKWAKAANEIHSLAEYNPQGIEKKIENLLLPNAVNKESPYQIAEYIKKEESKSKLRDLFGSMYIPVFYELQRI